MAKERLYGWNGEYPDKVLGGQAKIVFDVLKGSPDEMWTGKEWTEIVGGELRTTQDPYRVVLYYILILKGKGCIRTVERDINAVTREPETRTRHAVTVKQKPLTEYGDSLPEVRREERHDPEVVDALSEAASAALEELS